MGGYEVVLIGGACLMWKRDNNKNKVERGPFRHAYLKHRFYFEMPTRLTGSLWTF
jgi:hypothetical protein